MLQLLRTLDVQLIPPNMNSITQFDCDCPEYRNRALGRGTTTEPCKHGMAMYYELAKAIDIDPSKLFELRSIVVPHCPGLPNVEKHAKVEKQPGDSESQPVDLDSD